MGKQTGCVGGFVAQNNGNIENCYSVVSIKVSKQNASGFVGVNTGTISKSFSKCNIKHLTGGFVANDNGKSDEACYFIHNEKQGSKVLEKINDAAKGIREQEINNQDIVSELGFDTEEIWEYTVGDPPIRFLSERWIYDIVKSPYYQKYIANEIKLISIKDAQALIEWAKKVNEGDKDAAKAYVKLDGDIDLGGIEWVAVGEQRTCAFSGLFNGCGFVIKNFVIKDKKTEQKGFFGYLKGEVYNLTIDCSLNYGICSGGFVANNEGGTIGCCAALVSLKNKTGLAGGFVGINSGKIFQSYAAGKVVAVAIPWWVGVPFLFLFLLWLLIKPPELITIFAPVPYDQDQVPIPNEVVLPKTDGNFVSFQFEKEIKVNLRTGLCTFNFKNPGDSNHNIVVQLQFTDAQSIRIMGSTGRSEREQKRLEETPGYDPENYRMIIAQSGAIRPGYELADLKLVEQADGTTVPPGNYNAIVYLVFYDIETNNRAMLESQLPVVIAVQ